MVLFLFVIMLVRADAAVPQMRFRMQKLVALAVVFALGFEVLVILFSADKLPGEGLFVQEIASAGKLPPNSEALARSLFTTYSLPFEMAGVLLLVAIVGAVVMAKSRNRTDES
jgi:NADH-quinone oxidoreductase subunit J